MDYEKIKKLIPLYIEGGDLSPEEEILVETSIKNDLEFKKEVESYQKSWDLLNELDDVEPSPDYVTHFWDQVSQETTEREGFIHLLKNFARNIMMNKRLVPLLAVVCVVFAMGIYFSGNIYRPQSVNTGIVELVQSEFEIVENLELVEHFDIIVNIEFYEDFDIIASLDISGA